MKKTRLLREKIQRDLIKNVPFHLDHYRSGNFGFLEEDVTMFLEANFSHDEAVLDSLDCTSEDLQEVNCCLAIFNAMGALPPYLARDSRLWTYMTHTSLLGYARKRWPIPDNDEKAVPFIRRHYFAIGTRGIERENAASRLWWMSALCSRIHGISLKSALETLLFQSDVRANIIERPTTSQSIPVFSALVKKLDESYKGNQELFVRETFRSVMKELNLKGGTTLLSALDESEIEKIVDEFSVVI